MDLTESFTTESEEIFYPRHSDVVKLTANHMQALRQHAMGARRQRARICAHPDTSNTLHEMLIFHPRGTYVRPHKHLGKSESFHVIEGEADVILFDDTGRVNEIVAMGPYGSGKNFYYRLNLSAYHTLIIHSEHFIFHETTNGPFRREDTVFAPWAPPEENAEEVKQFMQQDFYSLWKTQP